VPQTASSTTLCEGFPRILPLLSRGTCLIFLKQLNPLPLVCRFVFIRSMLFNPWRGCSYALFVLTRHKNLAHLPSKMKTTGSKDALTSIFARAWLRIV